MDMSDKKQNIYCQAIFNRGSGLGGLLFPWARCKIFSLQHKIPMITSNWTSHSWGRMLYDWRKRTYFGMLHKHPNEVSGIIKWQLKLFAQNVKEPEKILSIDEFLPNTNKPTVIVFKGHADYFAQLIGWEKLLLQSLIEITPFYLRKKTDALGDIPIGISVRRGDFKNATSPEDYYLKGAIRTPLRWYIETLHLIRRWLGFPAKAYVSTDASPHEIRELLRQENTELIDSFYPIDDLLTLAKAKIYLAAGGSTFSCWVAFFGNMPTVVFPGQPLTWFKLKSRDGVFLGEFFPDFPSEEFAKQIKSLKI